MFYLEIVERTHLKIKTTWFSLTSSARECRARSRRLTPLSCSARRFSKRKRKQRLLTEKKTRENSMFSFYVTKATSTFSSQLILSQFFPSFPNESEQTQPEKGRDKRDRGQIYQQQSMFGSSIFIWHSGSHPLTQTIFKAYRLHHDYFTKSDINCLGTHYII